MITASASSARPPMYSAAVSSSASSVMPFFVVSAAVLVLEGENQAPSSAVPWLESAFLEVDWVASSLIHGSSSSSSFSSSVPPSLSSRVSLPFSVVPLEFAPFYDAVPPTLRLLGRADRSNALPPVTANAGVSGVEVRPSVGEKISTLLELPPSWPPGLLLVVELVFEFAFGVLLEAVDGPPLSMLREEAEVEGELEPSLSFFSCSFSANRTASCLRAREGGMLSGGGMMGAEDVVEWLFELLEGVASDVEVWPEADSDIEGCASEGSLALVSPEDCEKIEREESVEGVKIGWDCRWSALVFNCAE